jgi:hypothetical protein
MPHTWIGIYGTKRIWAVSRRACTEWIYHFAHALIGFKQKDCVVKSFLLLVPRCDES